jgi:hypothetical protein
VSYVAAGFVMASTAQRNAVFWVTQIFRAFTKTAPVMNFRCNVVALLTVMHALAERVQLQEPSAKV